ncbi:hypothetical protein L208DRAFT_1529911 [Tricholoma matsutake]|nr:hypothetical protein L208DRAFT_1529911 [Tricholoma matsutake 945]
MLRASVSMKRMGSVLFMRLYQGPLTIMPSFNASKKLVSPPWKLRTLLNSINKEFVNKNNLKFCQSCLRIRLAQMKESLEKVKRMKSGMPLSTLLPGPFLNQNLPIYPVIFRNSWVSLNLPQPSHLQSPHLSKLTAIAKSDPHLEATHKLHSLFAPEKVQDVIVVQAQLAPVTEPLPHSIWCKIVLDQYVDFKKLFASMDRGYDHLDDPKDFGGGFTLVKKEQTYSKHPLHTEADWIRVFSAWESAVTYLYLHHTSELHTYHQIVMDLF